MSESCDTNKNCMPGTSCLGTCNIGLKVAGEICQFNWECGSNLLCSSKCTLGEKPSELPKIVKMEKRMSEQWDNNINNPSVEPTLVRKPGEFNSFYKKASSHQNNSNLVLNTPTQNEVRDELYNFLTGITKYSVEVSIKAALEKSNQEGGYHSSQGKAYLDFKSNLRREDVTNHEFMHWADSILGQYHYHFAKQTQPKEHRHYKLLSYVLLKEYCNGDMNKMIAITEDLIKILNLEIYKKEPDYMTENVIGIISEIAPHLQQEEHQIESLSEDSFNYLKKYTEMMMSISGNKLPKASSFILGRVSGKKTYSLKIKK